MLGLGLALGLGWGCWTQSRGQSSSSLVKPSSSVGVSQFLVVAGGGAPSYNEIALEKNVLYFQRTLTALGLEADAGLIYFANGADGQATVRYRDDRDRNRYKVPEIPFLTGAATWLNVQEAFQRLANPSEDCTTFFYFTGHGAYNENNPDNNALILWQERLLTVQDLASWLEDFPADQPFVTMMAQCYSGAFANLIYEGGDPSQPVALQPRCGFFAIVAERPSVGCTAAVNEADYRDYSSSFFAGLSGVDRLGKSVASADYDQDGVVSYAEAHAFAKVDEETTDWPISTVEAWLQRQATVADRDRILETPLKEWIAIAAPARRYVIQTLSEKLRLSLEESYTAQQRPTEENTVEEAYAKRLEMELINVAMQQRVALTGDREAQGILEKLLTCEGGSWQGSERDH